VSESGISQSWLVSWLPKAEGIFAG
jgi:hypothetical protein